jgi:hypothetical protein
MGSPLSLTVVNLVLQRSFLGGLASLHRFRHHLAPNLPSLRELVIADISERLE